MKEIEKGRSCIDKCGSLLKTLIVYTVVALFLIPIFYETYNRLMHKEKSVIDGDYDTVSSGFNGNSNQDMSPEEIA